MPNMQVWKAQAQVFKALTHPTRLGIVVALRDGEACVCHLEAVLGQRQAAISQHLMVLRSVGLVDDHRVGSHVYYRNCDPRLPALLDALLGPHQGASAPTDSPDCSCPRCQAARGSDQSALTAVLPRSDGRDPVGLDRSPSAG